ncbi:MAG: hypothetical protein Q4P72_00710, partial [Eubacteriales bacterium]|nr:hypothetical protein [Eubacteriales bacterium]
MTKLSHSNRRSTEQHSSVNTLSFSARRWALILLACLSLIYLSPIMQVAIYAESDGHTSEPSKREEPIEDLVPALAIDQDATAFNRDPYRIASQTTDPNGSLDISANTLLVIENDHQIPLHAKEAQLIRNSPLAFQLCLALCVIDRFSENDEVVAAALVNNELDPNFKLKAGESYPVSYLLYGLLLEDSLNARLALCQALADSEANLIQMMNKKASALNLLDSKFYAIPLPRAENRSQLYAPYLLKDYNSSREASVSTAKDCLVFYQNAMSSKRLSTILKTRDYSYFSLNILRLFKSRLALAFDLFAPEIESAAYSESPDHFDLIIQTNEGGFRRISFLSYNFSDRDVDLQRALNDYRRLNDRVSKIWENTLLFYTGQAYVDKLNVEGREVGLKINKEVRYVHPVGELFIHDMQIQDLSSEQLSLPIHQNQLVARLNIHLENGTSLLCDLEASETVRAEVRFGLLVELHDRYPILI